jgi:hypothetical protein
LLGVELEGGFHYVLRLQHRLLPSG